jgi:RNA polymerase sigma factor (sigma-70 family)
MSENLHISDEPDPYTARRSALAELFEQHNQRLIGFLQTRLQSEQEAKEVAQESYARLLNLDQPETLGFLRAYLFKTAANLAIDRLRHRSTLRSSQPLLQAFHELTEQRTPEELTSSREQAALANQYLQELPEPCRRAFLLYRIQELSLTEVAAQMGVSDRMVRYYVVQAMSHCQARLANNANQGRGS